MKVLILLEIFIVLLKFGQQNDGLASYQLFSQDYKDSSGNFNDCKNQGGATFTKDRFGNENQALSFNGQNTWLVCPINPFTFHFEWTLTAWFYHRSTTQWAGIVSNNFETTDAPVLAFWKNYNYTGYPRTLDFSSAIWSNLGNDHFNQWIFAAVTQKSPLISVYSVNFINGSSFYSKSENPNWAITNSSNIQIGRTMTGAQHIFDGFIDDIRIYNRGLNISEIWQLYCSPNNQTQENFIQRCLVNCSDGFYMKEGEGTCIACNASCKTCNLSANMCTSCPTNLILFNQQCLSECPENFSLRKGKCTWYIPELVSFYPFNNEAIDESGNGNDCQNQGAVLTKDRQGNEKSAYAFNGVDSYLECKIPPGTFAENWTITAWINPRSTTNWGAIFSGGVEEGVNLIIQNNSNSIGVSDIGQSSQGAFIDMGFNYFNQWQFVVASKNDSMIILFVRSLDGSKSSMKTLPLNWTFQESAVILFGKAQIHANPFDGIIDDVHIQNKRLSIAELYQIYCSPFSYQNQSGIFSCLSQCADGFFMNKTTCSQCDNKCKTCNLTASHCTSCELNLYLFNQNCLQACPLGFIVKNKACVFSINDLVSFYSFSGNSDDQSGNGNDCINQNALPTNDRFGNQNNAFSFDGQKAQMQCPVPISAFQSQWTIAAWINHKLMTDQGTIISNNVGKNEAAIMLMNHTQNCIGLCRAGISNEGVSVDLGNDHYFKWIFVVISQGGPASTVWAYNYYTGPFIQNNGPISWIMKSNPSILIGKSFLGSPDWFFQGDIDDIYIFNRSLNQPEITTLQCLPNSKYPNNFSCNNTCDDGFFRNNSLCEKCNDSCLTCNSSSSNCLSCPQSSFLLNGKCLIKCPPGFTSSNKKCVTLNPDLISFYQFFGNASDLSGNGNDCTKYGAGPLVADRFGIANSAQSFDGQETVFVCPINQNTFNFNWTLSAWIFHRKMTKWAGIVSNNYLGNTSAPLITMIENTTQIGINLVPDWDTRGGIDLGIDHQNKWIYVVVMKKNDSFFIWGCKFGDELNYKISQYPNAWSVNSAPLIQIGRHQKVEDPPQIFDGVIDDIRIFNRSLEWLEVWKLFNETCNPIQYFQRENLSCLYYCPDGQFINGSECSECNKACKTCSESKENCLSCFEGFQLNQSWCQSLIEGLVSYYPMMQENVIQDYSGNEFHCSNYGATLTMDRFGKPDNAYNFNGNNSYVECQFPRFAFQNNWTMTAWINHKGATHYSGILSNNIGVNSAPAMHFNEQENYIGLARVGALGPPGSWLKLDDDHFNKWIFVVIMQEQSQVKAIYYILGNKSLEKKIIQNYTQNTSDTLWIGKLSPSSNYTYVFNGSIDDIRIQNRAISYDELQSLLCFPGQYQLDVNFSCLTTCPPKQQINGTKCSRCREECKTCIGISNNCTSCPLLFKVSNSSCVSIITGLVSYFPFPRNYEDYSWNENNCLNSSYFNNFTEDKDGQQGQAAKFDGINSFLVCPIPMSTFYDDWTVTAWINQLNINSNDGIVSNNVGISGAAGLQMKGNSNKIGMGQIGYNDSGVWIDLGADHFDKWYYIVLIKEKQKLVLRTYLFGNYSKYAESEIYWNINYTNWIQIGRARSNESELFNGSIDGIRIQNKSISIIELQSILCPNKLQQDSNASCLSNCPNGFQDNSQYCGICNQSCSSCVGNENNCTACYVGFGVLNGTCYNNCPDGQFINNSICLPCNSSQCKTCNNTQDSCTSCAFSRYLFENNCVDKCPLNSYLLNNSICISKCPEGTQISTNTCDLCNETCKACINFQNNCQTCNSNYLLVENKCLLQCPIGFKLSESNLTCNRVCQSRFFSFSQCQEACPAPFIQNNETFICEIPNECANASMSGCTECKEGYIFTGNSCEIIQEQFQANLTNTSNPFLQVLAVNSKAMLNLIISRKNEILSIEPKQNVDVSIIKAVNSNYSAQIILDISVPLSNGFDFCLNLTSSPFNQKVLKGTINELKSQCQEGKMLLGERSLIFNLLDNSCVVIPKPLLDFDLRKGVLKNEVQLGINQDFSDRISALAEQIKVNISGFNDSESTTQSVENVEKVRNLQFMRITLNFNMTGRQKPIITVWFEIPIQIQVSSGVNLLFNLSLLNNDHTFELDEQVYYAQTTEQKAEIQQIAKVSSSINVVKATTSSVTFISIFFSGLAYASLSSSVILNMFKQLDKIDFPPNLLSHFNSSFQPFDYIKDPFSFLVYQESIGIDPSPPDRYYKFGVSSQLWNNLYDELGIISIAFFIALIFFILQKYKKEWFMNKMKERSIIWKISSFFCWNFIYSIFFGDVIIFFFYSFIALKHGSLTCAFGIANLLLSVFAILIAWRFFLLGFICILNCQKKCEDFKEIFEKKQLAVKLIKGNGSQKQRDIENSFLEMKKASREKEFLICLLSNDDLKAEPFSCNEYLRKLLLVFLIWVDIESVTIWNNYSFFFPYFKISSKWSQQYLLFDFLRSFWISIVFAFLLDYAILSCILFLLSSTIMVAYIAIVRPFNEKLLVLQVLSLEVIYFIAGAIVLTFAIIDTMKDPLSFDLSKKIILGNVFIQLMQTVVFLNTIYALMGLVLDIIEAIKERKEAQKKVSPDTSQRPKSSKQKKNEKITKKKEKRKVTAKSKTDGLQKEKKSSSSKQAQMKKK